MTVTDFLASGLLILNSVDFKRQFRAACGYAELGMTAESIAELNAIDDEFQHRPEVLQLRLHHLMRKPPPLPCCAPSQRGVFARRFLLASDRPDP
jgi:hypothetical protein